METAQAMRERLQAALAEAIGPWCGTGTGDPNATDGSSESPTAHTPDATPQPSPDRRRKPRRRRGSTAADVAPALDDRQWRALGRDVLALHQGYTRRNAVFAHETNPIHARLPAYQLYFLPRNWYRVHRVIAELPWDPAVRGSVPPAWLEREGEVDTLHLLDLGCGTGAFSLAWLTWLAGLAHGGDRPLSVHLTLVDQGHTLLELAVANLEAFARRALPGVRLHCSVHADGAQAFLAQPGASRRFAIAGAAMTLNELSLLGPRRVSARATGFAQSVRRLVRPGGCLLFVEPGTRKGYMNLMALREHLLQQPMLYPCPHNAPCPMWGGTVRDWCHSTEPLPEPFFFDDVLRRRAGVSFEMRDLQLAALAMQATADGRTAPPFVARAGERLVSAPMRPRKPRGAKRGAPAPAAGRVVLACAADGRLHERPAPPGGPYLRGHWHGARRGPEP